MTEEEKMVTEERCVSLVCLCYFKGSRTNHCFRLKSQELTAKQLEIEKKQISATALGLQANLEVSIISTHMHIVKHVTTESISILIHQQHPLKHTCYKPFPPLPSAHLSASVAGEAID